MNGTTGLFATLLLLAVFVGTLQVDDQQQQQNEAQPVLEANQKTQPESNGQPEGINDLPRVFVMKASEREAYAQKGVEAATPEDSPKPEENQERALVPYSE